MIAKLALEDGCVFTGRAFGATGTRTGEVVFNTAMTGYQEIFTDPSYSGQIVTMTFPLQGNYGVNADDFESAAARLSGMVVKELPTRPSNHRATESLPTFLKEHGVIGLCDIDTRALTRRIRMHGAVRGALSTEELDDVRLVRMAAEADSMVGANLVDQVAPQANVEWTERLWQADAAPDDGGVAKAHIVALDCGIKHNILRHLATCGCRVTVVGANATPAEIRALAPDGLLVGNGPGDPQAVTATIETLRELLGVYPTLGICLGHQLLALALGATTYKLKFGHHGGNQPVLNRPAERVEITSQNHGFAVDAASLKRVGAEITHVNLNDRSAEGFVAPDQQILAVQFHPEASPGPHDCTYVLSQFADAVARKEPLGLRVLRNQPAPEGESTPPVPREVCPGTV
ncbi:MAG: glutamine-hydrolyzing carbamoyl-phosphate synthase small subunit [Phycisphaerae bacterium]